MSSNINIQRICQHCNEEFTAHTTVTRYCSHRCNQRAYKAHKRKEKISRAKANNRKIEGNSPDSLNTKAFLTVREVAKLLNCSVRTIYHYITIGHISAYNLGQRLIRVKRTEIDNLFEKKDPIIINKVPSTIEYNINECYTLGEIRMKYGISSSALQQFIKKNKIFIIKRGKYNYIPKKILTELLE
jgi:excisionase family DNA binding protein